ncbi:MAG: hypothetical protein PF489_02660 [Salinivirgaceae bacterium]|jgi:hypothetical protein|nr:hypothetical protein [Salinivirgaceae bacterium]
MFKLFLITVFTIILYSCHSNKKNYDDDWCKKMEKISADCMFKYQINDDAKYLDSALFTTDKALRECSKQKVLFSFRKLDILSKQQDYTEAISFIKSMNEPIISELTYYNDYLENRYKAMYYQSKGNLTKRDSCLNLILLDMQSFIKKNNERIIDLLRSEDVNTILENSFAVVYIQYFYTKSILEGTENIKVELDSLQSSREINKEYVDFIYQQCVQNDFMDYVGF